MRVQLYNKSFTLSIPIQTPSRTVFRLYDSDSNDTMKVYNLGANTMRFEILTADYPFLLSYDLIKKANGDFVLDFSENEIPLDSGVYDCALYLNDDPVPMPGKVGIGIMLQDDQYIGIINSSRNAIKVNDTVYENPVFKDTNSALMKVETDIDGNQFIGIDVETGIKLLAAENIPAYGVVTADGHIGDNSNPDDKDAIIGIVISAVDIGMPFTAYDRGTLTKESWTWEANKPIYLSGTGLSQTKPVSGFIQIIGVAINATSMVILISADGVDGATWRDGSGVPSNTIGVDGDYYFRTDTSDVYKRSSGTYSTIANIKGAQGIQGNTGPQGPQGPSGAIPPDVTNGYLSDSSGTIYFAIDATDPVFSKDLSVTITDNSTPGLFILSAIDIGVENALVGMFLVASGVKYTIIASKTVAGFPNITVSDKVSSVGGAASIITIAPGVSLKIKTGAYAGINLTLDYDNGVAGGLHIYRTTNSASEFSPAIAASPATTPTFPGPGFSLDLINPEDKKKINHHYPTSSPYTIDLTLGQNHILHTDNLTGSLILGFSNPLEGFDYYVEVAQGSTPYEVTLDPGLPVKGGTAYVYTPTANAVDVLGVFFTDSAFRINFGPDYKIP